MAWDFIRSQSIELSNLPQAGLDSPFFGFDSLLEFLRCISPTCGRIFVCPGTVIRRYYNEFCRPDHLHFLPLY